MLFQGHAHNGFGRCLRAFLGVKEVQGTSTLRAMCSRRPGPNQLNGLRAVPRDREGVIRLPVSPQRRPKIQRYAVVYPLKATLSHAWDKKANMLSKAQPTRFSAC